MKNGRNILHLAGIAIAVLLSLVTFAGCERRPLEEASEFVIYERLSVICRQFEFGVQACDRLVLRTEVLGKFVCGNIVS